MMHSQTRFWGGGGRQRLEQLPGNKDHFDHSLVDLDFRKNKMYALALVHV